MKERLAQFIAMEGISRNDFANQIGVQRSNITHILDGRNKPSYDFIEKTLMAFPQVNAEWLLLGRGEMYKQPTMVSLFPEGTNVISVEKSVVEDPKLLNNDSKILLNESKLTNGLKSNLGVGKAKYDAGGTKKQDERISGGAKKSDEYIDNSILKSIVNENKVIERIIILYTDKSFETFTSR